MNVDALAELFNIPVIGICRASYIEDAEELLPRARCAIICAQNYFTDDKVCQEELFGVVAPFARRNYYKELRKKIEALTKYLKREKGASSYISVNGRLKEKKLAAVSGVGFYGKNSIIINKTYGSFIVLGAILTDIDLEITPSLKCECGSCNACIDACPTGAIAAPGKIERAKCLQQLSQEKYSGVEFAHLWDRRLYGCSVCQDVCPMNRNIIRRRDFPQYGDIGAWHYIPDMLYLADPQLRQHFAGSQLAASWIDPAALIKNGLLALFNDSSLQSKKILRDFSKNGRNDLRETAKLLLKM